MVVTVGTVVVTVGAVVVRVGEVVVTVGVRVGAALTGVSVVGATEPHNGLPAGQ